MSLLRKQQINITTELLKPNAYAVALNGEFSHVAFDEVRAPLNKGKWRDSIFKQVSSSIALDLALDLEIGTGNGLHFAHQAHKNPNRLLVGIELKYKPLIQSIRRAIALGCTNVAMTRYHAFNVDELFTPQELNNIFIHFPDPWVTPRKPRNRLVNREVLAMLHSLQKPGSYIDFKTDSREYFLWALDEIQQSPYRIIYQTFDLHKSEYSSQNFVTQFESLFVRQGIEINFLRMQTAPAVGAN